MSDQLNEDAMYSLLDTCHRIHLVRDLSPLKELITDSFLELTHTHRGFLFLVDPQTGVLVQHTARTSAGTEALAADGRITAIAKRALDSGKTILTTDSIPDGERATAPDAEAPPLKMVICTPLAGPAEPIGVLYADSQSTENEIASHPHRRAWESFAAHAGAAVANAQTFERATNDPLTGLPNSSSFLLELKNELRDATEEAPLGVLLIDMDAFKRVNHAGGAEAGDRALIDVGATLQEILRTDGVTARYGSDKFAILLPPDNLIKIGVRLRDVAERARAAIAAKSYSGIQLSACIGGIGLPHPDASTASEAVALADDLLRTARGRGRGEVEIY